MRHTEVVKCEMCGTLFTTNRKDARFCSMSCANKRGKPWSNPRCPHNVGVVCECIKNEKCASCGWNPVVAQQRSNLLHQKLMEVPCNG